MDRRMEILKFYNRWEDVSEVEPKNGRRMVLYRKANLRKCAHKENTSEECLRYQL